jgi:hypothetical protein
MTLTQALKLFYLLTLSSCVTSQQPAVLVSRCSQNVGTENVIVEGATDGSEFLTFTVALSTAPTSDVTIVVSCWDGWTT